MFYYLSQWWMEAVKGTALEAVLSPLRLFTYITFRSAGAAVTALVLSWWLGPKVIEGLKRLKFGQAYKDRAETAGLTHSRPFDKTGTPTMGGAMIVLVLNVTTVLWAQWNTLIQVTILSVIVLAVLGFFDDWAKITKQSSAGTTERVKLVAQFGVATFIAVYLWLLPGTSRLITEIVVPFYKYPVATGAVVTGIVITVLTIVCSSNAVNLTDGLDGLAIGCTVIVTSVFLVVTYLAGDRVLAARLLIPHVPGASELTVFCAALIGAGLGFLWFNCFPARVFMGDTGSLPLGGALGIVAVLVHQPFLLVIAGGIFVIEAGSVVIQRGWFKYTRRRYGEGRRVFLMAPLHHHFEKKGWLESQVVMRFLIICILFAVIALSTLKIR
jgi:phospho-N-acetylmuramoyl-pentapeptide-transferase